MSFYELKNVSKKALWAAVTFHLKVLVILLPLFLFIYWPESTEFSIDILSKILVAFFINPLTVIMPSILFFLFLFIGIAGKRPNQ
jgi:energy-coupling factor transporter transmembrane protein EcfT|tara:strand:- start:171 stop:425 length:255 start_codon:yes stop_codon:yes gene_type:complete